MITVQEYLPTLDPVQLTTLEQEIFAISQRAFDAVDSQYIQWRLTNMPSVSVFTAREDNDLLGFKAGYALTDTRYYSWFGAVDPRFQRKGAATKLMKSQHEWLSGTRFSVVETHVRQNNKEMVKLNHQSGFVITGLFVKQGEANFIMQKNLKTPGAK